MKGKRIANTVCIVIVSLCLLLSLALSAMYGIFAAKVIADNKRTDPDPQYAMFVADGDVVTKRYDLEAASVLKFFDISSIHVKRTRFTQAVPQLKIINDTEYFLEVTANRQLHDILEISSTKKQLEIGFREDVYNRVYYEYDSYYDLGLYVDCDILDVVVHAPVSELDIGADLVLDFEAPKSKELSVSISSDNAQGRIYNIDAKQLTVNCSGSTRLKLSGTVSIVADMTLYHDSHVDARDLTAQSVTSWVSRGLGGFSYILAEKWYDCNFSILCLTNTCTFLAVVMPLLWVLLEVKLIRKRRKLVGETQKDSSSQ